MIFLLAFKSSFICLRPLVVTASGNSARDFSLERVTFFTSIKALRFYLILKNQILYSIQILPLVLFLKYYQIHQLNYFEEHDELFYLLNVY